MLHGIDSGCNDPYLSDITCPRCGAVGDFRRNGSYERSVVTVAEDGSPAEATVTVRKVFCRACRTSHAVIPGDVVPLSSYAEPFRAAVREERSQEDRPTVGETCSRFGIDARTLYRIAPAHGPSEAPREGAVMETPPLTCALRSPMAPGGNAGYPDSDQGQAGIRRGEALVNDAGAEAPASLERRLWERCLEPGDPLDRAAALQALVQLARGPFRTACAGRLRQGPGDRQRTRGLVEMEEEAKAGAAGEERAALSSEEIGALLEAASGSERDHAALALMVVTAARPSELCAARVGDFSSSRGGTLWSIRLRYACTGGSRTAHVPREAADLVSRYLEGRGDLAPGDPLFAGRGGRPLSTSDLYRMVRGCADRVREGRPDLLAGRRATPTEIRRATVLRAVRSLGLGPVVTNRFGCACSPGVTSCYLRPDEAALESLRRGLDPDPGVPS